MSDRDSILSPSSSFVQLRLTFLRLKVAKNLFCPLDKDGWGKKRDTRLTIAEQRTEKESLLLTFFGSFQQMKRISKTLCLSLR